MTLKGIFKHLKRTFDDTKQTLKRELATGTNYSESSSRDGDHEFDADEEENDENHDTLNRHRDEYSDQSPSHASH